MSTEYQGIPPVATPDVTLIRQKLLETMVLGLPETDSEKPVFYFERQVDWDKHDAEGSPWNWTDTPTLDVQPSPVSAICGYEFFSPLGRTGAQYTEVGEFNPTTVVFTFLEAQFAAISGFSKATVGPGTQQWFFRFWKPAYSIEALTVYQVQCVAEGVP